MLPELWGDTMLALKGRAMDLLVLVYRLKCETDVNFTLETQNWDQLGLSYFGRPIQPKWRNKGDYVPFHKCSFMTDNLYSNVVKLMTRKFPELADITKTSGWHSILQHQSALMDELLPYYELYASITDFDAMCREALAQSTLFVTMDFKVNGELCDLFLDLFVLLFKLSMFSVSVMQQEKRAILSTYAKLYYLQHHEHEPRWNRILKYIHTDRNWVQNLQDNLSPFSACIAKLCFQLQDQVNLSLNLGADGFRNLASLSLTPQFSGMKYYNRNYKESRRLPKTKTKRFSSIFFITVVSPWNI